MKKNINPTVKNFFTVQIDKFALRLGERTPKFYNTGIRYAK
ncbi:MAG: hypothetical protein WCR42_15120 [bacterium]